ncbi:hypothetical protein Agub_g3886 [Astrephomene gubernaculifera]|uniref:Uncharacterized protein n=1 Tax=Astrephomene gubernaculifera TaxID=47775 RepID=A0AAD3DKL6_9CHLO|nr:hypothetical protein Agub_g3886 [Astrephomene gubernaculifera]
MSALVAAEPPPESHYGPEPRFPLFRARYCAAATWSSSARMIKDAEPSTSSISPTSSQRPNLRSLDLRSLPVEDTAPSETQLRRQKYLYFEKHCSEVSPGLFLSGDYVAKTRDILRQAGVTHVLNCVGFICKEYFKDELTYKTLYLQDTPAEDISCVLYDCLDYIHSALQAGGRILVHCSQGVSRSATLVIAYMMWRCGKPYDEIFAAVKAIRGVANPNIGFTCQLLQWQKRAASAKTRVRLYRIAPHCVHAPSYLVPKLITPPKQYPHNTHRDLDPRGAFVLQTPAGGPTYVWRGEGCPDSYAEAAHRAAWQLRKFEGAGPVVEVRQGQEPVELRILLDPAPLDAEAARLNAKRSSITGEIDLATTSREHAASGAGAATTGTGGAGQQQGQGQLSSSSAGWPSSDMDVDFPGASAASCTSSSTPFASGGMLLPPPPADRGPQQQQPAQPLQLQHNLQGFGGSAGGAPMDLGTPRGESLGASRAGRPGGSVSAGGSMLPLSGLQHHHVAAGGMANGLGGENAGSLSCSSRSGSAASSSGGAMAESGGGGGGGLLEVPRWVPKEVDEYTDDYLLFGHSLGQQGKGAASGGVTFDGTMRVSYDTAGGLSAPGIAAAGPQAECLFGGPNGRPDSPATKEGRHKKFRRADSERPKLGYWTAACSDGIGPELARTHNVSSLHESVDEDVLGLPLEGR